MRCQNCTKQAILHITEVAPDDSIEELHLCDECGQKYLTEPKSPAKIADASGLDEHEEALALNERQCEHCGIKFVEFRNTGRLGCPHDYSAFRAELAPLLESIHGATKHLGKSPRRLPQTRHKQQELANLKKRLMQVVAEEDYEEAAKIRDRIRELERD